MITQRAVSAVEDILKAASFDVDPGTGGASLTAYRDDECLIVLCSDDPDEINEFAVKSAFVFLDCQHVCQCLARVFKVGQSVYDWNISFIPKLYDIIMFDCTNHDCITES